MGKILKILLLKTSTLIELHKLSNMSTEDICLASQGRALKAYGFEVRAPTGHISITLALNSSCKFFLIYVVISILPPRPVKPKL